MKPPVLMLVLLLGAFLLAAYVAFQVLVFRLSCALAGLARPTVPRSVGIVCAAAMAVAVANGVLSFVVTRAYVAGGYPLWEAGLVAFFVGLPVHMLVCALTHKWLLDVRLTDGIAVWVFEESIKTGIIAFLGLLAGLVFLLV
jgi:hypothetical protein